MESTVFDRYCEELAQLARDARSLPDIAHSLQNIEQIESGATSQHFKIVLVSSFQGGKSTIFNTLCGGRELSPTGFGLKTSAAVAEAHFLDDEHAPGICRG